MVSAILCFQCNPITMLSVVVLSGDEVKFKCQVTGEPMPTVRWYKDGVPVDTWVYNKDMYVSQVSVCRVAESGLKCTVSNEIFRQMVFVSYSLRSASQKRVVIMHARL